MNRWLKTLLLLALGILLVFAALRWAERMTVQELTRTARPDDAGAVCIVWKPRLISGGGSCVVEVRDAADRVTDSAPLGTLTTGHEALQRFGQLVIRDDTVVVSHLQTGEVARQFVLRDGRLHLTP